MRARSPSPAPDRTDQLCAIESIWHSSLLCDPSGVAIVEVGAAIPLAVPAVLLDVPAQPSSPRRRSARRRQGRRAPRASSANCLSTSHRKKASQTLSPLPCLPTRFMPSFQSPEPISGSPCSPNLQPSADGADAMLVQSWPTSSERSRQIVVGVVLGVDRAAFQEVNGLVQHAGVARAQHVTARRQRQPEVVVRAMRAHAAARRADATSAGHPLRGTDGSRTAAGARARVQARRGPAPSRPAADRGSRRRRPIGSSRCAPRHGRPGSGTGASHWSGR